MQPKNRYPIYVISKGRADCCLTAQFLLRDGVPFSLVIEPQEEVAYANSFSTVPLYILPFSNLGLGSIPARNWVWEHAKEAGHERHWILDDNIRQVYRRSNTMKLLCNASFAFAAIEDFTDRYENIAIAGMNYFMFAPNGKKIPPLVRNVHVYSNLLIKNDIPQRWRGRYNEDTDLCLQVLSAGLCTVLFNAFLVEKMQTMTMKGGNSTELYQGDGRLKMAKSLERLWPGIVTTQRRFKRPQHVIKNAWRGFTTPLILRPGVDTSEMLPNEYGMRLVATKDVQNTKLRSMLTEQL